MREAYDIVVTIPDWNTYFCARKALEQLEKTPIETIDFANGTVFGVLTLACINNQISETDVNIIMKITSEYVRQKKIKNQRYKQHKK